MEQRKIVDVWREEIIVQVTKEYDETTGSRKYLMLLYALLFEILTAIVVLLYGSLEFISQLLIHIILAFLVLIAVMLVIYLPKWYVKYRKNKRDRVIDEESSKRLNLKISNL